MQLYTGLPIATNKISGPEKKGIPHHLLGCLELGEEPWTVRQFHERAINVVRDIRNRGKLPIIVGGTQYYIQSLLLPNTIIEEDKSEFVVAEQQATTWPILNASTEEMLEELRKADPDMASRWHPKDRRKIRRSLEIWLQTGRKASDIYSEQRDRVDEPRLNCDIPISDDPLVFWTHAPSAQLNPRLDSRVDDMISHGLLHEVVSMFEFAQARNKEGMMLDQSRGIWVAIGYKEFLPYMANKHGPESMLEEGTKRTKVATRQYCKRQTRWIRLKLFAAMKDAGLCRNMFLLDATDVTKWSSNVEAMARDITRLFLSGNQLPPPKSCSDLAMDMLVTEEKQERLARYCEACDKTLMSEVEWLRHLKSKSHRGTTRPKIDWHTLYPQDELK